MTEFKLEPMEEGSIESFRTLSAREYQTPEQLDAAHLRWKHISNPFGRSIAVNAYEGQQLVGHVLLQPRELNVGNGVLHAAFMIDLLVHPDHRQGGGVFLGLMRALEEAHGFDLVCHSSNLLSDPLFQALSYPAPIKLSAYALPLGLLRSGEPGAAVPRIVLNVIWRQAVSVVTGMCLAGGSLELRDDHPGADLHEEVCAAFRAEAGPHYARSTAFLKWRFTDAPLWRGTIKYLYSGSIYRGYLALSETVQSGRRFMVLSDAVFDPDVSDAELRRLRFLMVQQALADGYDALYTMVNPRHSLAARMIGFPLCRLPERLLPHPVPIYVRPFSERANGLAQRGDLYITLADLDYF
jgi:hypothetical protein